MAAERGIAELGVAEHVYRFAAALDVWQHPLWRDNARDDLDAYCAFVREETDLRLGIEADFIPGREDRMAELLERRDWDYVVGSVHFLGDHAVDYDNYDVWTRGHVARQGLERRTSSGSARPRAAACSTSSPTPTSSRCGAPSGPRPEGDLRRFYDRAMEGDRRVGHRRRGVDRRAAQAGRRALPRPRVPRDGRRRGQPDRAVERRAPARPARLRLRATRSRSSADLGVTELCVFEGRERRLEPIGAT